MFQALRSDFERNSSTAWEIFALSESVMMMSMTCRVGVKAHKNWRQGEAASQALSKIHRPAHLKLTVNVLYVVCGTHT